MATVVLPRSLVALFPGAPRQLRVDGKTVADVLDSVDREVPGLRNRLCDSRTSLRPHINVFVDGAPAELETIVASDGVVHVIPAVSGG